MNITVPEAPTSVGILPISPKLAGAESRYFALDAVRATAMLLGVLYHAIFFGGGMMRGFGQSSAPSTAVMNWIHSFRMPLFFLISGFFCHMMFQKYGLWKYLARRWFRIGLPFLVALGLLGAINSWQGNKGGFPGGGPPGGGFSGRVFPPRFGFDGRRDAPGTPDQAGADQSGKAGLTSDSQQPSPLGFEGARGPTLAEGDSEMPAPPPGFVPPFLSRFDSNHDGTLDATEWAAARAELRHQFGNGEPPGPPDDTNGPFPVEARGDFSPGPQDPRQTSGDPIVMTPDRPFGGPFPGPRGPGGFRGGWSPFGQSNPMAEKLFGKYANNLRLQHLWFLWYLLVFATAAPFVAIPIAKAVGLNTPHFVDRITALAWNFGLAPLAIAAVSIVGLHLSGATPGQPPGGMATIFGSFPDVLFRYDRDWPYFFTYFLAGGWLFSNRVHLNAVGRHWYITLALGLGAHVACSHFEGGNPFQFGPSIPLATQWWRYFLFGISVAATSFGFIGFFQRFLNRPTRVTRYLSDTAFWIYLVHQDLLNKLVLNWVRPWSLPGLIQALVATSLTCAIALVAFELMIRRTPLTVLFGPPRPRTPRIPTPA